MTLPYQHAKSDLKFILNYVLFTLLSLEHCTIRSGTRMLNAKLIFCHQLHTLRELFPVSLFLR